MKTRLASIALAFAFGGGCAPKEYLVRADQLTYAQALPAPRTVAMPATRADDGRSVLVRADRLDVLERRSDATVRVRSRRVSKMLWGGLAATLVGVTMAVAFGAWLGVVHASAKPCTSQDLGCALGSASMFTIDFALGWLIAAGSAATVAGMGLMLGSQAMHPQEVNQNHLGVYYLGGPALSVRF